MTQEEIRQGLKAVLGELTNKLEQIAGKKIEDVDLQTPCPKCGNRPMRCGCHYEILAQRLKGLKL